MEHRTEPTLKLKLISENFTTENTATGYKYIMRKAYFRKYPLYQDTIGRVIGRGGWQINELVHNSGCIVCIKTDDVTSSMNGNSAIVLGNEVGVQYVDEKLNNIMLRAGKGKLKIDRSFVMMQIVIPEKIAAGVLTHDSRNVQVLAERNDVGCKFELSRDIGSLVERNVVSMEGDEHNCTEELVKLVNLLQRRELEAPQKLHPGIFTKTSVIPSSSKDHGGARPKEYAGSTHSTLNRANTGASTSGACKDHGITKKQLQKEKPSSQSSDSDMDISICSADDVAEMSRTFNNLDIVDYSSDSDSSDEKSSESDGDKSDDDDLDLDDDDVDEENGSTNFFKINTNIRKDENYRSQCLVILQNEYKKLSAVDIRRIAVICSFQYAPTHRVIHRGMKKACCALVEESSNDLPLHYGVTYRMSMMQPGKIMLPILADDVQHRDMEITILKKERKYKNISLMPELTEEVQYVRSRCKRKKSVNLQKIQVCEEKDMYVIDQTIELPKIYQEQCLLLLQNEFRQVSVTNLRVLVIWCNWHYAATRKILLEGLLEAGVISYVNKCDDGAACGSNSSDLCFKFKEEMSGIHPVMFKIDGKDRSLPCKLLKSGRHRQRLDKDLVPRLQNECDFVQRSIQANIDGSFNESLSDSLHDAEPVNYDIECGCCFGDYEFEDMVQCYEGHLFCEGCLSNYAREAVYGQGKSRLECMTDGCNAVFPRTQLEKALPEEVFTKYEERCQEEALNIAGLEDLVRCPGCDLTVELDSRVQAFVCPKCSKATCRYCKEDWADHVGIPCEQLEKKDETKLRLAYEEKMTMAKVRYCHKCKAGFTKTDGCNRMTCRCGATMCYICRQADIDYNHFCRHVREPGQPCATCTACSLWTNPDEDDDRAIKELEKEANKARQEQGYAEYKKVGATDLKTNIQLPVLQNVAAAVPMQRALHHIQPVLQQFRPPLLPQYR